MPRDEFIDDIPYPETQNYVKRILGTAEDYRRLYGELGVKPLGGAPGTRLGVEQPSAPAKQRQAAAHVNGEEEEAPRASPRHDREKRQSMQKGPTPVGPKDAPH